MIHITDIKLIKLWQQTNDIRKVHHYNIKNLCFACYPGKIVFQKWNRYFTGKLEIFHVLREDLKFQTASLLFLSKDVLVRFCYDSSIPQIEVPRM